MHSTSELYNEILGNPTHRKEVKYIIAGVEHGEAQIISGSISGGIFEKPGVGNCIARQFDFQILPLEQIPEQAEIDIYVRLVLPNPMTGEIVQASEWIPKGVCFIDEQPEDDFGAKTITAYDAMLKAEQPYLAEGDTGEWPRAMTVVVNDIAQRMGVDLDSRTKINPSYVIEYPDDFTMREILSNVAAAHAGNWIITDSGKLQLIGLSEMLTTENHSASAESVEVSKAFQPYSKVIVWYDDENAYTAGDDTGRTLEIDCVWATQAMTDNILATIKGFVYKPYSATNALLNPAAELGDGVTVNGVSSVIEKIGITIDRLWSVNISAPWDEEINHQYPYLPPEQRALARKVSLNTSYYGASITRKEGLVIEKTDGENVEAKAIFNADTLAMQALINGQLQNCIYFDTVRRKYCITGSVVIDGSMASGATITNVLYAERGDISELTVDQLRTSKRVSLFLNGDTSDDDYIDASGVQFRFITGSVQFGEDGTPLTEQLKNRYGALLYWAQDISDATIRNGGPYIDGERICTTTDNTGYPVMVYQYAELVKAEIKFESIGTGEDETVIPVLIMGAGSGAGDNKKAKIYKDINGLVVQYTTASGTQIGVQLKDDGAIHADGPIVLGSDSYGDALPATGIEGQIFFVPEDV